MPNPTLAEVCSRALRLPCSPSLLPRLISLLEQPETDVADLAALVQLDPVLAGATVRMANSVYFGGGGGAETVAEAVMRLGARELYRLAALSLTARWMSIEAEGYRWEPGDFCRGSLVNAVAAEILAERTGRVAPALAYTCGLVHELGKLAIAHSCSAHFGAIRARAATGLAWLEAESEVLGFNHAAVGARLLTEWHFPASCIAVVAHNPPGPDLPAEYRLLAGHVHAAHHLATALGAQRDEDAFLFKIDPALIAECGLDAEALEQALPIVLERSSRLLGEKLTTGKIEF